MTRLSQLIGSMDCDHCLAVAWLENKGWKRVAGDKFAKPFNTYDPTDDELLVLNHLVAEWDFRGIDYGSYYSNHARLIAGDGAPIRAAEWCNDFDDKTLNAMYRGDRPFRGGYQTFGSRRSL